MKWRFTYKEFSLLLGIVVAVIIMLTLWLKPLEEESGDVSRKLVPKVTAPTSKTLFKKAVLILQESVR